MRGKGAVEVDAITGKPPMRDRAGSRSNWRRFTIVFKLRGLDPFQRPGSAVIVVQRKIDARYAMGGDGLVTEGTGSLAARCNAARC